MQNQKIIFTKIGYLTPFKINLFLLFKLPSAWLCGVRLNFIDDNNATVFVKHRWINQNPFNSLYFAVQNMAAELSTGVLVMRAIKSHNLPVSMLVIETRSQFFKKATGSIKFECTKGENISRTVNESIQSNSSKTICVPVKAYNSEGEIVSEFSFTWSIKPKTS
jgi:hypothetical protein